MRDFFSVFALPAALLAVCSTLLMIPMPDENRPVSVWFSVASLLWPVVLPLAGVSGNYTCFAVMLTLCAYLAARIYARYKVSYPVSGKSPRTIRVRCEARMFYSSICLICGSLDLCLYKEVPEWITAIPSGALALLLAFRAISGRCLFIKAKQPRRSETAVLRAMDMNDSALKKIYDKAVWYMEQKKPYVGGPFTESDLARMIGVNRTELSRAIALSSKGNFSAFVNDYRVQDAVDLMSRDPNLKVSQAGNLSGFQSESTFLKVFKEYMRMTPSEFLRHARYKAKEST